MPGNLGRQSIDNVLICQEILHSISQKKGRKGAMVINLDLEKAYNRMEWSCILDTLYDDGIPENLTQTIMRCIKGVPVNLYGTEKSLTRSNQAGVFDRVIQYLRTSSSCA